MLGLLRSASEFQPSTSQSPISRASRYEAYLPLAVALSAAAGGAGSGSAVGAPCSGVPFCLMAS